LSGERERERERERVLEGGVLDGETQFCSVLFDLRSFIRNCSPAIANLFVVTLFLK
jgi:hypothetical protein